ncbi:hypothetical protein DICPUDRAFT_95153 [Dictyostelium purpureum]|uniref:Potassium transporter n=1 Tax=Dictyostelium purpureum TaxID=5786 RepID=F0ZSV5_DICPU|nr:uncharacterized protein DICPUDRAFT_95153 [Dictyostelium purpureum]EGC32975.1 hypothetical protein DICPUDRAFT_95153 [Dictyostelium purpureum]|eukprot:XP_003290493.1 hypothetical protein DICPUDRAFT_95153 [Dictyostelium purpureum]
MMENNNNNNNNQIINHSFGDTSSTSSENLVDIKEEQVNQNVQKISDLYPETHTSSKGLWGTLYLSLTAIGVIFGDIGTSVLYVYSSMFSEDHPVNEKNIIGSLSLIIWALIMVVCVKYMSFILQVDNNGEGGIIALTSLIPKTANPKLIKILSVISILGSSFILGDGVITPAVSLLSAVEGLEVGIKGDTIKSWIIPITVIILFILFAIQSFGTEAIGIICGPVLILWFFAIGIFGLIKVVNHPVVFRAFNPWEGISHFLLNGPKGFLLLGTVILCVTGCEALYADLGHFGKKAVRIAWFFIAFPCLLLNYMGQAALYIENPHVSNPFFELMPRSFLWPMIILATLATVIASQALISGAFSIINQAISLKFFPPLKVKHTSKKIKGQIYISEVNWALCFLTLIVVIGFKHSSNLIAAYGLGVALVMLLTTIMYLFVLRLHFNVRLVYLVPLSISFIIMDGLFFTSSVVKIPHGGWFPLAVGFVISSLMLIFKTGREKMVKEIQQISPPLSATLEQCNLGDNDKRCNPAVFFSLYEEKTPLSLLKLLPFLNQMPYPLFFVKVYHLPVPFINEAHRIVCRELIPDKGVYQVALNYGYSEVINIPKEIKKLIDQKIIVLRKEKLSTFLKDNNYRGSTGSSGSHSPLNHRNNDLITDYHYDENSTKNEKERYNEIELDIPSFKKRLNIKYIGSRERVKAPKNQFFLKRIGTFIFDILLQNSRSEAHYFNIHHESFIEIGNKIQIK